MFQQDLNPVGDSLALSALCAAVPLLTLFVLLGGLRLKAWLAGLISLAVALVVAIVLFAMPAGQALLAATEGAAFGFFPILWIVINAIWVYNLTVASGHFDVLRRSFEKVSPDQRIQAIIIAFCFGALLEALAGFGTPVAITVVMLMALGFKPIKAASVALVANTAPVAFGALATPIVTLATVSSGASNDPGLTVDTLGAMVGRQTPILAVIVPAGARDHRGRQARSPGGVAARDRVRRWPSVWPSSWPPTSSPSRSRTSSPRWSPPPPWSLLLRVWKPAEVLDRRAGRRQGDLGCGCGGRGAGCRRRVPVPVRRPPTTVRIQDSRADVAKAYAPYLVIIAIFSIVNIPAVKEFLATGAVHLRLLLAGPRGPEHRRRTGHLDDLRVQLAARPPAR